jgi:cruciform cutting endonuclease 1
MGLDISLLKSLKNAELKALLLAIGAKSTGTKDQLCKRLERDLYRPKIAKLAQYRRPQPSRILSIDMGIKNLGLCVSDVDLNKSDTVNAITAKLNISRWERLMLLDSDVPTRDLNADGDGAGIFSPSAMSTVACRLVQEVFMPLRPSVVLIEQQRFRSGGASAITEWTVRVNMLEAMLWALFRALKTVEHQSTSQAQPELYAVSPSRVASFWLPGLRKVEKKTKVDLVRTCISQGVLGKVKVEFGDDAAEVARGFDTSGRANRNSAVSGSARSKLDDLADSFLQASAWVAWEANRRNLIDKGIEKYLTDYCNSQEAISSS